MVNLDDINIGIPRKGSKLLGRVQKTAPETVNLGFGHDVSPEVKSVTLLSNVSCPKFERGVPEVADLY